MAFRPDYSPILAAGAAQGQGLAALGSGIRSYLGQRREDEKLKEQQALGQQKTEQLRGLYDQALGGNVEAQNQLAFEAPKINAQVMEMLGAREESQQKGMIADAANVISLHQAGDKDQALNLLNKRIEAVQARGGDPSDTIEIRDAYEKNPEIGIRVLKSGLQAMLNPEDYAGQINKPVKETAKTATQKDFSQYQKLKGEDPIAAKEFGKAAGFIDDGKKRLFQVKKNKDGTTTKYFSDGTEQIAPATEKVKTKDMKSPMSQDQAIKIVDKAKEGQLKNAGFALTLNDGLNTINSMISKGYDPMSASWVNKYLAGTTAGNLIMTPEDQTFVGSVEQMINAIARRETGAAITAFEKEDFFNRYMPVAGDSKARINQKKSALERQFKSIRGQSGSVYDAIRVSQGIDDQAKQPQQSNQAIVIKAHPTYGDVTEDDIKTTMAQSGMTREQVLSKLGG